MWGARKKCAVPAGPRRPGSPFAFEQPCGRQVSNLCEIGAEDGRYWKANEAEARNFWGSSSKWRAAYAVAPRSAARLEQQASGYGCWPFPA